MIYVYDIILNWTDEDNLYEFFEWNTNDDLEHIKRIPMFKISSSNFDLMLNYEFKVNAELLDRIKGITEIYTNTKVEKQDYALLFTDGCRAIAVEFDEIGKAIYRSKMLIDEEQDVLILSNKLLEYDIDITCDRKRNRTNFKTRLENEMQKVLTVEIKDSYTKKRFDKLKYLYYECFGREEDNIEVVYNNLLEGIKDEKISNCSKMYDVVKLSYQSKR